jgi:hypothetical protein
MAINLDPKAVEQAVVDAIIQSAIGDKIKKAAEELKAPEPWISS